LSDDLTLRKDAVDLIPRDHPDKPSYLNTLGNSFLARFEHLGELNDPEQAISKYRNVVDLASHYHSDKPNCLNNLDISS
ncbi:hypothetical protein J3R83DRAFT_5633, partial [Lanmaoa asiatica]